MNFTLANGYYVFNLVTNDLKSGTVYKHPLTDPRARTYSPIETTDAAVKWIKSQPAKSAVDGDSLLCDDPCALSTGAAVLDTR